MRDLTKHNPLGCVGRVRIILEFPERPDIQFPVLEYDHIEITRELGYDQLPDILSNEEPVDYKPNGKKRLQIKAWSKCLGYEDFEANK
jgi:hypothetical protein